MKVVVYAISKNEEEFVNRWYNSMKEADEIYVLDTGSTDNTVTYLKNHGVIVKQSKIKPWRFDKARNISLKLVPLDTDICVCTDLDEVFEKGWRDKLEKIWDNNTTRVKYTYNWFIKENEPQISFYLDKIHARNNYCWIYPVHEVLQCSKIEKMKTIKDIILNHYPKYKKERTNYLKLLKLSIKENKNNDRCMHYLGREYMYHKKYKRCIKTLTKHINLSTSIWKDERSSSMRFIARSYYNLNNYKNALYWYKKALKEAPHLREPYVELALFYINNKEYKNAIPYLNCSLKLQETSSYTRELFTKDNNIYKLLSISYFYTNDINNALLYINKENKKE